MRVTVDIRDQRSRSTCRNTRPPIPLLLRAEWRSFLDTVKFMSAISSFWSRSQCFSNVTRLTYWQLHWITVQIISLDSSSTIAMKADWDCLNSKGIPTTAKIVWDSDCYRSIRYPGCNKGFNPDRCYNRLGSWM